MARRLPGPGSRSGEDRPQLRTMMDEVVQKHRTISKEARPLKHSLSLKAELLGVSPRLIGNKVECLAQFAGTFLKGLRQLLSRFELHGNESPGTEIQSRFGQNCTSKLGELGDVRCKPAQRS